MRAIAEKGVGARLNLGCGDDIREGYLNVDVRKTHPITVTVDLSSFPWPFEDGSAAEILMFDFLEHFSYRKTPQILLECHRVLQSCGEVVIQVPDGPQLGRALSMTGEYFCNRCGGTMGGDPPKERCESCGQSAFAIAESAIQRLYGGQDYTGNWHQTTFTPDLLEFQCNNAGLVLIGYEEQDHQEKNWNFKARYAKDDPWKGF